MKHMKKLLSLLLVLCLVLSLSCTAFAAGAEKPLDGKTVILHSNDVHGAIDLYAAMAALKADYEAQGAEVILADAGDYSQGTVYVSVNKGADAVTMMNATGYDVVTLGNHEFDYGYAQLVENMKAAKFQVLCADVLGADGKTIYDANTIIEKGGVKIGFFGLETPEAQTKANPKLIQGLKFLAGADGKELYNCAAAQVADLKAKGADLVVCLAHLGVDESSEPYTSYDLAKNVQGIDFIIDGHSHTVMTAGPNGEPIQSTGTAFANIGVITIDNATKKIVGNELKAIWHTEKNADGKSVTVVDYKTRDEKVAAAAKAIIDPIDKAYGEKFAVSEVALNGAKTYYEEKHDKGTFVKNIITDNILPGDVYIRAKELHFVTDVPRAVFLIRQVGRADVASVDVVAGMFPDRQQDFVLSINETDIAVVKQIQPNTEREELIKIAQTIEQTLHSELFIKTVIGIGTVASHLRELADSFKEAQVAIEVGKVFDTEKTIINYENLGIGRLIYQLPTTLCEIFLSEVFKKNSIDTLDQETLFTINKFFENNLNVSETSRKLFVHRNTLVYRLEKIKKLTGLDLREFDDAIIFKVALMVKKYLVSRENRII